MMKKGSAILILAAAGAVSVCQGGETGAVAKPQAMEKKISAMSDCDRIQALIKGHSKGFAALRREKAHSKLVDVWKARYHLVGDSCQVWGWGAGKYSYMCALTSPNRETARSYYDRAKAVAGRCLGKDWQLEESMRQQGEGFKAQFSRQGGGTAVGVQAVATPGLFKTEWTTYFFVGDPNDML